MRERIIQCYGFLSAWEKLRCLQVNILYSARLEKQTFKSMMNVCAAWNAAPLKYGRMNNAAPCV